MAANAPQPIDLDSINTRLSAIERSIAEIQAQIKQHSMREDWLDNVIGSISDHEAFEKVLEYGREFRKSQIEDE